jgi:hypothetical protein
MIAVMALFTSALSAVEDGLGTNVVRNLRVQRGGTLSLGGEAITNWTDAPAATNAISKTDAFTGVLGGTYNSGITLDDNAVTTTKIANDAVTGAKIATGAVGTDEINDLAVTEAKIADNAVTNRHIADAAVDTDQLNTGAVTETKIGTGAVTTDKIGANAVTSGKIADGTITNDDINTSANIAPTKIAGAALVKTTDFIGGDVTGRWDSLIIEDNAVTTDKIADGNVTSAKLAGSITITNLTVDKKQVLAEASAQDVAAGAAITVSGPFVPIRGTPSAVSATIAAGTTAGQTLILRGISAVNTVQITNNAPLVVLDGGVAFTMGTNDVLSLVYNGAGWVEIHRADN